MGKFFVKLGNWLLGYGWGFDAYKAGYDAAMRKVEEVNSHPDKPISGDGDRFK